ncbi:Uncharacterised protein [Mycobacteroides abscessus subsp. massiliense]|nr:Uncharacterised protein [Mycobacteroides abscessus subsp. massiliense]
MGLPQDQAWLVERRTFSPIPIGSTNGNNELTR